METPEEREDRIAREATKRREIELSKQKTSRRAVRTLTTKQITEIDNLLKATNCTIEDLEDAIAILQMKEESLIQYDSKIEALFDDDREQENDVLRAHEYREKITLITRKAKRRIASIKEANPSSSNSSNSSRTVTVQTQHAKLPKLTVRKFDGDITQWTSFWNQFSSAVHKQAIDKVEKFTYLESYLEGEAKLALTGMYPSDATYDEAIQILEKRFGQTDLVVNTHMNKLLFLKQVFKTSDLKGLRELFNTIDINIRSLKSLNQDVEKCGMALGPQILESFPEEIRLEYRRKRNAEKKTGWDIAHLVSYLREEIESRESCRVLGAKNNSEKSGANNSQIRESNEKKPSYHKHTASALTAGVTYQPNNRYSNNYQQNQNSRFQNRNSKYQNQNKEENVYCIFCEVNDHKTTNCSKFSVESKRKMVREQSRCYLCLRKYHDAKNCQARFQTCVKCQGKHNFAVCDKNPVNFAVEKKEDKKEENVTVNVGLAAVNKGEEIYQNVLLQSARAIIRNPERKNTGLEIRCFLDSGAQASFVRQDVSRRLKLPVVGETNVGFNTFMSREVSEEVRKRVRIILENVEKPEQRVEIIAIEVPYVCNTVTAFKCNEIEAYMNMKGWQLADKPTNQIPDSEGMELLIGGDYYWTVASGKTERFGEKIMAVETKLGWTIQGPINSENQENISSCPITVMRIGVVEKRADEIVQKFWKLESIGIENEETKGGYLENQEIIERFNSEIKLEDGRYHVKFPWKLEKELLPNNLGMATKRGNSLVRRFIRDPILFEDYKKVIDDQLENGIVEIVPENSLAPVGTFYLPHQPVKSASATTSLRVVLDGSAHEKGSPSLNDCLSAGPNLNPDILLLLLRFRINKIAFVADIEKAFLQIALADTERDSVRFLWVNAENHEKLKENDFKTLRMTRVPFGITSSPLLLALTIKYHIHKVEGADEAVVKILDRDLYVDDLTGGENNLEKAYQTTVGINQVISGAKMRFRKWNTNSPELRKLWGDTKSENSVPMFDGKETPEGIKILGLKWNPNSDIYTFDLRKLIEIFQNVKPTKRCVISAVAQIFDPLGVLSAFTIRAKILFQKLWIAKVSWDETLGPELAEEFLNWCRELPNLRNISMPRHYFDGEEEIEELDLHCFTDASQSAYAVVIYVRYVTKSKTIGVSFVASKARVAPLKLGVESKVTNPELSVPRLELMGCNLGARLMNYVKDTFKEKLVKTYMWTDSTIALYWIRGATNTWKPFISNRVSEIQKLTKSENWHHCPGVDNPADIPTRGVKAEKLPTLKLWWEGPSWLKQPSSEWPKDKSKEEKLDQKELGKEMRKSILVVNCETRPGLDKIIDLQKYSKLDKVLRITVYVKRFYKKYRNKGPITADEMAKAEIDWVKCIQERDYAVELATIKLGNSLAPSSKIATLHPVLNNQNQLCVGGRLEQLELSIEQKHPIILNSKHRLARLITERSHNRVMHGGVQDTITQVRERYWVLAGRQLAKKVVKACMICRKQISKAGSAITAPLPKDRIEAASSFSVVGIDFAGPLYIKGPSYYENNKNLDKAYICLITCAVTRAIHLELVPSLSTEEFMLAFERMVARRGTPHTIYSDNAKTFERADKDLQNIWKKLGNQKLMKYYGEKGIHWKFIAERAAWWGGFYEIMVKSTKRILKKVLGSAILNYTEMETILLKTEAAINSRPLTYVYNDSQEPIPISPSHFWLGKRVTSLPPQTFDQTNQTPTREQLTNKLKYRQQLLDRLWKRWQDEYLLQLRNAHHSEVQKDHEIQIGDVVLIHQDKKPKHEWRLGVITENLMGRDNKVRACMVRLSNGSIMRRPIQLLYPLEIKDKSN